MFNNDALIAVFGGKISVFNDLTVWLFLFLDDPSITIHGNLFHGVFEGTVYTPDEEYHIEPADR